MYTKVKKLLVTRGNGGKIKVSPLLAKLIEQNDLTNIPAIMWGRVHDKDTSEVLFTSLAKVPQTPNFTVLASLY